MDHSEMVALIRGGVPHMGGVWADLGAGTGNFTRALRELLGPLGTIYAIDRDARAIDRQRALLADMPGDAAVVLRQADVTRPLDLPALDGILMANLLHFIRDQATFLPRLVTLLRPGGRLLVVEYDVSAPLAWVPAPVPPDRLSALATAAGLSAPIEIGRRRSPSTGLAMYAAVTRRPSERIKDVP